MNYPQKNLTHFVTFIYLLTLLLISLNLFGNPLTFRKLFIIPSIWFAAIVLVLFLFLRLKYVVTADYRLQILNKVIIPISLLVGSTVILAEYITSDNYVYSILRLNPHVLLVIGHIALFFFLLFQNQNFFKKFGMKVLTILPFWYLLLSLLVWMLPLDKFVLYRSEDGLVENIQFFTLMVIGSFCLLESYFCYKNNRRSSVIIFALLGCVFLVVGLEEISWGQRLIGLETPAVLKEINVQQETTIHNIGILNYLQMVVYVLLSLIGTISPLINKFKKLRWSPPLIASLYFMVPLFFYSFGVLVDQRFFPDWSEVVEVLFYFGLAVWVLNYTRSTTKHLTKKMI